MTFKVIGGQVKVTWDLKFQKWRFSNSISSTIFQPFKKFQRFLILDRNISKLPGRIFEFPPSYRVTWLQTLPKNRHEFFSSNLNETWYDVRGRWDIHDDNFQGYPRSGSRSGDDLSPLSGLFFITAWPWRLTIWLHFLSTAIAAAKDDLCTRYRYRCSPWQKMILY